ncbi:hypothetical protein QTN24_21785 [Cupriavidus sp. SZY C1]|uniref:hypothetical protein n=1 Tax=Cupriavidus sp. SZY C1 TaxID=3055037 RepID=UPI0028B26BD9|nr:hypothetical protein [Cupriavidus sp. SZY C1]MDT6964144.1 hypothetical protein [Cupriavidus sp. SZY C1]
MNTPRDNAPQNTPAENDTNKASENQTVEIKVSGDGNGLVDDETSGHVLKPEHPAPGKTPNERLAGEGDADATSQ